MWPLAYVIEASECEPSEAMISSLQNAGMGALCSSMMVPAPRHFH